MRYRTISRCHSPGTAERAPSGAVSSFDLHAVNNGAYAGTGVRLRVQLPSTLTGVAATSTAGTCAVAERHGHVHRAGSRSGRGFRHARNLHASRRNAASGFCGLSAGERDNAPTNNTATASATAGEVMDLGVTIAPSSTTPQTGTTLTYSITVSNKGLVTSSGGTLTFGPASGISLASTLPAGCTASGSQATCTLGMIAPNGTQAFSFTATANTAGTNVANASVAGVSGAAEMNAADNSASSTVTVSAPPTQNPPANSGRRRWRRRWRRRHRLPDGPLPAADGQRENRVAAASQAPQDVGHDMVVACERELELHADHRGQHAPPRRQPPLRHHARNALPDTR